jgi:hypothetical protein
MFGIFGNLSTVKLTVKCSGKSNAKTSLASFSIKEQYNKKPHMFQLKFQRHVLKNYLIFQKKIFRPQTVNIGNLNLSVSKFRVQMVNAVFQNVNRGPNVYRLMEKLEDG